MMRAYRNVAVAILVICHGAAQARAQEALTPAQLAPTSGQLWDVYRPVSRHVNHGGEGEFSAPQEIGEMWGYTDPFQRGSWSLQFLAGAYFVSGLGPDLRGFGQKHLTDRYDYAPLGLRLCRMLNTPDDSRLLFWGNWEYILEFTAAPVFEGFGNIVIGGTPLMLRYNFVKPDASLVPYLQAGAGIVYTDGYKDRNQEVLGQATEFLLQAQVGVRCFVSERWSLDIEGGIQHISNAKLADRNGGINNLGGSIGFTYHLPCWRR